MKKVKLFAAVLGAVALIAFGFWLSFLINRSKEPNVEVSATSIAERLKNCSELATSKLEYRGLIHYSEGEIAFITKKGFSMVYDASIKAGIDLSEAKISVDGKLVSISLPEAKILDISIDSDSLEFYDEKFALFNWTDKKDTQEALGYAMDDATSKVDQTELMEQATLQAKVLVENLLSPITGTGEDAYTLEFTTSKDIK